MKRKWKWETPIKLTSISLGFCFLAYKICLSFSYPALNEQNPICFFSNDLNHDCELALNQYVKNAEKITYSLYSLTDKNIKRRLHQKKAVGRTHKKRSGLMHQKILCLDSQLFLGTMNMTPSSIRQDKNLFFAVYSPYLSSKVNKAIRSNEYPANLIEMIDGQTVELCFLPQDKGALATICKRIREASHSIIVAMFYLSHPEICDALQAAFLKGILVKIFAHTKTKQLKVLEQIGIPVRYQKNTNLMHLKWMVIDESILFVGSTNWTKNAFRINDEAHLWLYPLTKIQLQQMNVIWDNI